MAGGTPANHATLVTGAKLSRELLLKHGGGGDELAFDP
jgi:hypothetical protein